MVLMGALFEAREEIEGPALIPGIPAFCYYAHCSLAPLSFAVVGSRELFQAMAICSVRRIGLSASACFAHSLKSGG